MPACLITSDQYRYLSMCPAAYGGLVEAEHGETHCLSFPDQREAIFLRDGIMELAELSRKMNEFVDAKGWYDKDSPKPQTSRNLAISLVLETSEVLELFQWKDQTQNPNALAGELADVMLYTLQIASINGIDLEQAILDKLENNYSRTWDAP